MSRKFLYLLLLFLMHFVITGKAETTDSDSLKQESLKIRDEGIRFSREGLDYEALEKFKLFLEYRKIIYADDKYFLGAGFLNVGVMYKNLGQFNMALESFKQAEQYYLLRGNPNNERIGALYINIGNVYRAKLDYVNASNYFERALVIFQKQEVIDTSDISNAYYSLSELNFIVGNYNKSIDLLEQNIDETDIYTRIYFNELLALNFQQLNNNSQALYYYKHTLSLATEAYSNADIELAIVYMNYADFLISANKFDESLKNIDHAFAIISKSQSDRGEQLSRYYESMGSYFRDKPIESRLINHFKQEKKLNLSKSIDWYKKGLNALSTTNDNLNIKTLKIQDCLSFLDNLAIIQQIGDTYYEIAGIDKEEKTEHVKNSLQNALEYYHAASMLTQQARKEISSDKSKIQLANLEYYTFTKTIKTAYLAYEVTNNREYLELAFNNSEQLKSSSVFDKLSDDLAQENSLIPDSLIQYEKKLNSTISIYNQKIFEENNKDLRDTALIEKYSQAILTEKLNVPDSALINKFTQEILIENNKEKADRQLIETYKQRIFEENSKELDSTLIKKYEQILFEEYNNKRDSSLIADYSQHIFEASKKRDELNRLFEEEYPDYFNLKYSNSMLSISQIQKRMDKYEVILEYVIIDSENRNTMKSQIDTASYLFTILISKENQVFNKTLLDNTMENSLENVFSFMSNPAYIFTNNDDSKKFCVASHQLYNLLIAPFEDELLNKNLVFIPDGILNYIAFDGLLKTLPDTSKTIDFSKLEYLVKDYNINYANSVNILFQKQNNKRTFSNQTLAFAPEYQSERFEMKNASYTLMPLPGVQKEVDAIAKTIRTTVYRGKDATEKNFRENSKYYDILHLAMHAYLNDTLPAFSRLAFYPQTGDNPITSDGWLNTSDIYNLDLTAKLAVLSACNTGVGKLQKGEGMMSLARGFLYAGCPSVIMSLWEVEDEAGTQIMSLFYKNLKKGKTKDEALRLAKLTYLENSNSRLAHPHYWMSFKSIGDNSPIYTSYDVYFFALLIFLIMAFTIDQTLRIRKVRRNKKQVKSQ